MRTIESQNFRVHELADGVFAALDNKQGYASSNCGIVDLGGRTVVFDTSESLRFRCGTEPPGGGAYRAGCHHDLHQPPARGSLDR